MSDTDSKDTRPREPARYMTPFGRERRTYDKRWYLRKRIDRGLCRACPRQTHLASAYCRRCLDKRAAKAREKRWYDPDRPRPDRGLCLACQWPVFMGCSSCRVCAERRASRKRLEKVVPTTALQREWHTVHLPNVRASVRWLRTYREQRFEREYAAAREAYWRAQPMLGDEPSENPLPFPQRWLFGVPYSGPGEADLTTAAELHARASYR